MLLKSPNRAAIMNAAIRNLLLINLFAFLAFPLIGYANAPGITPAGYNLIGTIRSGYFSGAVIIVTKGEQSFFRLFDKLPDGSQIVGVRDDSISLRGTDGMLYDMYISHEKIAGSTVSPPSSYSPSNINPAVSATSLTSPSHLGAGYAQRLRQQRHRRFSSESEDE